MGVGRWVGGICLVLFVGCDPAVEFDDLAVAGGASGISSPDRRMNRRMRNSEHQDSASLPGMTNASKAWPVEKAAGWAA